MPAANCPRCGAPLSGATGGICALCAGRLALDSADLPDTADAPLRGARLGDYELLEEVGRGAMGVVYRARQLSLKRVVALKVVQSGQFASEAERKRFLAEAELAATLDHPNIVPVYEVGTAEGRPFCAMRFVEGRSLAAMLHEGFCSRRYCEAHRPPPRLMPGARGCCITAAALMARVARAVHHAHQRGIIHRDLKPGNILVDTAGEPHITDFGLARRLGAESSLTLAGSPLGTPAYMSPEQARGERTVTTAADIWSLGVILYELLTGRPPFHAENVPALLRKIVEEAPPRITNDDSGFTRETASGTSSDRTVVNRKSEIVNRIDPDLATIAIKCLEKEPTRRYASAAELADDLDRWQRHEPILARRSTAWERAFKWTARHPRQAALVVLLHVILIAGVTGIFWQWRRAERETVHVRETAAREAAALLHNEAAKDALLEQARAFRTSGQPGQRIKALEALAVAARIRPGVELRNEALAALALPDVQEAGAPIPFTEATGNVGFDADVRRAVSVNVSDQLRLVSLPDGLNLTNFSSRSLPGGWLTFSPDGHWLASRNHAEASFLNLDSGWISERFPTRFGMKHHAAMEFSPDNRQVAIADGNETITLIEVESGASALELKARAVIDAFAFAPDGRHLAVLAGRSLQIRRLSDGALQARYLMPPASWVAWQADGARLFVCSPEGSIRTVEGDPGQLRGWASPLSVNAYRAVPHPRGALLATASPGWVLHGSVTRLWDATTGRFWLNLTDAAYHFSRDGQRLACVRNNASLVVWNVLEADAVRSFPGPTNAVRDVDVSPDGHWLAAACDDGVRLWKLASGQELDFAPLPGARTVEFAVEGRELFIVGERSAWRAPLVEKERRFFSAPGIGDLQSLDALPPRVGRLPVGTNEATHLRAEIAPTRRARLTDARSAEVLAEVSPPDGGILTHTCFSRDGKRVVALAEDGAIHVWDLPKLRAGLAKLNLDWTNAAPLAIAEPAAAPLGTNRPLRRADSPNPIGVRPRDPAATANLVDLTPFYNALLTEHNWINVRAGFGEGLGALPQGVQILGGVAFDVRGVVHLASLGTQQYSDDCPAAVTNIPLGRACRRLQFLGAAYCFFPVDSPVLSVGHYTMRYADGESLEVPLRLDEESGMFVDLQGLDRRARLAEVAWTGEGIWPAKLGGSLQLFKWTWENPRPDAELTSLDFVSAMTRVAPFLIAITAE